MRGGRLIQTLVHSVIMKPRANQFGLLQMHRPATRVLLWSQGIVPEDHRLMRVPGRSCLSLFAGAGGILSGAQAFVPAPILRAFVRALSRLVSAVSEPTFFVVSSFQRPNTSFNRTAKMPPFSFHSPRVAAG